MVASSFNSTGLCSPVSGGLKSAPTMVPGRLHVDLENGPYGRLHCEDGVLWLETFGITPEGQDLTFEEWRLRLDEVRDVFWKGLRVDFYVGDEKYCFVFEPPRGRTPWFSNHWLLWKWAFEQAPWLWRLRYRMSEKQIMREAKAEADKWRAILKEAR